MSELSDTYYDVFEIHTLPRHLIALTLRVNKKGGTQFIEGKGTHRVPVGSLTIVIGNTEDKPEYANFFYPKYNGFNNVKHSTTKSFPKIHKRIDAIKDALNHTNLHIFINGEYHNPYKIGVSYKSKGIYHGIKEDEDGTYHYFTNKNTKVKEYCNLPDV